LSQITRFLKLSFILSLIALTTWFVTRNSLQTTIDFWPLANPLNLPVYSVFGLGIFTGVTLCMLTLGYGLLALYTSNQKLKRELKLATQDSPKVTMKPDPTADVRLTPDL
jgi:hypothetical protein